MKPVTPPPTRGGTRAAAGAPAPKPSGPIIGKRERQFLARLGKEAHAHLIKHGLTELPCTEWRHAQQLEVTGFDSLTKLPRSLVRTLKAHYLVLLGRDEHGYKALVTTGPVHDHGPAWDTHEAREEQLALIRRALQEHVRRVMRPQGEAEQRISSHALAKGGVIGERYLATICERRFSHPGPDHLDARQLRDLHFTIKNRIAAREGRGASRNRNKGQH